MIDAVMYGMMPSAKIVRRRKFPPLKRSIMPSTEPRLCSNKLLQQVGVDSRRGDKRAETIHPQQRQRKQHTITQVRRAENVSKCLDQLLHFRISTLPPAPVIFSCADLLKAWACTVRATFSSPSPRIFTPSRLARTIPSAASDSGVPFHRPRKRSGSRRSPPRRTSGNGL